MVVRPKFEVGTKVLIRKAPDVFQKGYKGAVKDDEVFVIERISIPRGGGILVAKLRDRFGATLLSFYYFDQLIEVG